MAADVIAMWGHALAALSFACLAGWLPVRGLRARQGFTWLLVALCATSGWALTAFLLGARSPWVLVVEVVRNGMWLGFTYALIGDADRARAPATLRMLFVTLAGILALQLAFLLPIGTQTQAMGIAGAATFAMIFLAGALITVHNVFTMGDAATRRLTALPLGALAMMWTYDLNLYTIAALGHGWPIALGAARGFVTAALVPVMALTPAQAAGARLHLSRGVAFRSASILLLAGYFAVMLALTVAAASLGDAFTHVAQCAIIGVMSVLAALALPSRRFRGWAKVMIAKHFFHHRYDYRAEWLRFTETMGRPGRIEEPLPTRAIRALADICATDAGLLFTPQANGALALEARFNWPGDVPAEAFGPHASDFFATTGYIVALDALRAGTPDAVDPRAVPQWLYDQQRAWTIVPCIHFDRLTGLAVLGRPAQDRQLDWEDLDMLRVAGRQVASYLAEAAGQAALVEARQFDEFNRRFAFIIHDIKNLVSGLALVARNAERHADNPAFRADMVATLSETVARMNELLARLSHHNKAQATPPRPIALAAAIDGMAQLARHALQLKVECDPQLVALADPARLTTILTHLVQNAVEASAPDADVRVVARRRGHWALIDVIDDGHGMDEGFIRNQLFKPFVSSKKDGFGIGAYESRILAEAMGGRLEVESHVGRGTRFTLMLPVVESAARPVAGQPAARSRAA